MSPPREARPSGATLRDVSRLAGVAPSTASRVLRGVEGGISVSADTRERILEAARQVGYRPNPLARGLRGARSGLLGVVVRDLDQPFFGAVTDAIAVEARTHGWTIVLGRVHQDPHEALALAEVLETRYCEAMVVVGDMPDDEALWDQLPSTARIPLVGLFRGRGHPGITTVDVDSRAGVRLLMEHLHGLGHRRIAHIGQGWGRGKAERTAAYEEFAAEHGLRLPAAYRQLHCVTPADAAAATARLLSADPPPTAIFATTDVMAIAALGAAYDAGVRVPEQLSVAGFDDLPAAAYSTPPLTTVRQPLREIVRHALDDVARRLASPDGAPTEHQRVMPELRVRRSTAHSPDRCQSAG